jgi:hypothetical protein
MQERIDLVTARVSVEQASTFGWSKYVGATGHSIGVRSFGASAPLKDLAKKFGFTPEHVVAGAREQLIPHAAGLTRLTRSRRRPEMHNPSHVLPAPSAGR